MEGWLWVICGLTPTLFKGELPSLIVTSCNNRVVPFSQHPLTVTPYGTVLLKPKQKTDNHVTVNHTTCLIQLSPCFTCISLCMCWGRWTLLAHAWICVATTEIKIQTVSSPLRKKSIIFGVRNNKITFFLSYISQLKLSMKIHILIIIGTGGCVAFFVTEIKEKELSTHQREGALTFPRLPLVSPSDCSDLCPNKVRKSQLGEETHWGWRRLGRWGRASWRESGRSIYLQGYRQQTKPKEMQLLY